LSLLRRHAPALLVLAGLAAVAALVALDEAAYLRLRQALGLKPFVPFLDLHAVMSAIECHHRGIDVYATNPCDALGRPHIYSPLWLRLPALFGEPALLRPLGLALALAFTLTLLWLPRAPRGRGELAMLLAVASPVTLFALERANVDLLIFALVVPGAMLLARGPGARLAGHALFLLAGALKFYPLVLLATLVRERPGHAFLLLLVAATTLRAFTMATDGEVQRAIENIQVLALFWGSFAAHNLPRGLLQLTGSPLAAFLALAAGLLVGALAAWRSWRAPGLAALPAEQRMLLLVSGLLVSGCFLAGENIDYRAILVLPALPALLAVPATRHAGWLAAALMWEPLARRIVVRLAPAEADQPSLAFLALWAVHNLAWWWLAAVLLTAVALLLRDALGLALLRPWATGRRDRR
jgi:hypothetical protein